MRRTGNAYDDTKTEAEQLVFRRGKELGLSVNALRPPLVYGPYDRQFLPRVLEALRAGRALLIAGGRAPLNMVWVDHVVEVLLRVAARSDVVGQCFNVMDELDRRPPSVREVIETIARAAELPPPRISLPYPVAMVAAGLVEFLFRFVAATKPPPLTRFVVKALTRDVIYDSSKAAEVLGWKPQVHSLEGIAREVRRRLGTE
jgi:nucleoside-diphosphate-sugar epimerase